MAILAGDIKLTKSQVMDDVPEGGGAPTSEIIEDNVSNAVFNDISESDRAGGRINMRKVNVSVQTDNRDTYLGANVIVGKPPNDPNVAITIFKANTPFDRRTDAQNQLEAYAIRGTQWSGYLLENHVANMRSIQIFQRPGTAQPNINRTLCLVYNEGLSTEREQYIRVTRVESEQRMFTEIINGTAYDFLGEVVTCQLSDRLRYDFPGSPASRTFAPAAGRTVLRDTTVADAGSYFGVVPLELPAAIGDSGVQAESVYTQLVPSARTESVALDQRPAAERALTLATAPRLVQVAAAPHTMRIKIGQENRGFAFTQILAPFPAPGTVAISFRALGSWYTVLDDGNGALTGSGAGTVNYTNGSIAVTFPSLPDVGSSVIFSWGEKTAFTNRSGQAGFRAPEFAFTVDSDGGIVPGSVEVTWLSGGVTKTATANTIGELSGDAVGTVSHANGFIFLQPTAMIDAGGTFNVSYDKVNTRTEDFAAPSVDAGGFAAVTLPTPPVAGSVTARWVTVRDVNVTSGADAAGSAATKTSTSKTTTVNYAPPPSLPPALANNTPGEAVRVPFNTGSASGQPAKMQEGGYRDGTTNMVYIAVYPIETEPNFWLYPQVLIGGVTWTNDEFNQGSKLINGVVYRRWGTHTT